MNREYRWIGLSASVAACALYFIGAAQSQSTPASVEQKFEQLCAGCHGPGGSGGDRAPALSNNRNLRTRSEQDIKELIRTGTQGGMPAFPLPDPDLTGIAHWVRLLNLSAFDAKPAGDIEAGRAFFFGQGQCSTCHMVRGVGKVNGPDLSEIGRKSTTAEINAILTNPTSQMGIHTTSTCPSWAFCPDETWGIVNVHLRSGTTIRGFARNQTNRDIQLQDLNGKMHMLNSTEYDRVTRETASYMPPLKASATEKQNLIAYLSSLGSLASGPLQQEIDPPSAAAFEAVLHPRPGQWPNYDGGPLGNRYSTLTQINRQNVSGLQLNWTYALPVKGLQLTPVVVDDVMYVTGGGQVCALDASSGRQIWCFTRGASAGQGGQGGGRGGAVPAANIAAANSRVNRGAVVIGDRVIVETGDTHLICLHRLTGAVLWDANLAGEGRYFSTAAPLVIGDLVVAGVAGGDGPLRGFLAAVRVTTGQEAWRFWTIPKPGEPGSETWEGNALPTGGGATWVTGSYDPESNTVYWAVGNPFPATDGDERKGVNLYTNCVLALDTKTGSLRWFYQFTPHDLHDWDATEPFVLVDTNYQGRPRKLLLQANRNGFFYVLDRTNGQFLLGKPFVQKMNWASGIDAAGKPMLLPAYYPTKAGVKTCPSVRGATNWYSTSYSFESHLFYVMAAEDCSIYKQSGRGGYEGYRDPLDSGKRFLRALDIETGKMAWEVPQVGAQEANYSGVLSTAGGLVFYGETGGSFAAADSKTGALLWNFTANEPWKASPMTYSVKGRQYVAITSGGSVLSFALRER